MSGSSGCVVCHRSFGVLLWKHECSACCNKICDDCAPKISGRRVCSACAKGQGSVEAEREKRMRAAQERMHAAGQRGRPQQQQQRPSVDQARPVASQPVDQARPVASQPVDQARPVASQPVDQARPVASQPGSNPVLEAAMRRQQQQKEKQCGSHVNSSEKSQLIAEIVSLLNSRREEEPFGLRSMDETKLRLYLRHIREKK